MQRQEYKKMFKEEDSHWWFCAKRNYIETILPKSETPMRILDVGSGTGGTSLFLQRWGNVLGIEQAVSAIPYLKKRKVSFKPCSIETFWGQSNAFDLICFFDVLYHKKIKNDFSVLQKAYRMLKKGKFLCITDCALPFCATKHDQIMHARQRYRKKELEEKIIQAGFIIRRSSYIYFLVFPFFLVQRILSRWIPTDTVKKPNPFIQHVLSLLCNLDDVLLRYINLPIGSSIIILAQKS